ncbi:MAG: hypothetical protein IPK03_01185 [Bacteroidetes bacterium]|nr:hypothetical protein [Bacteroidota bacterium]
MQWQCLFFKGANRTTTGTYIDTIKDNNGCDSILTLNLTVSPNSSPTISISTTSSTTICPTASVTFNASVTNAGPNQSINGEEMHRLLE